MTPGFPGRPSPTSDSNIEVHEKLPHSGGVELQNVMKRYGNVVAVDGVSLSIPDGSFFSLLGPSGCGKTTILRLIGGFEIPDGGSVRLGGAEVASLPPHRRNVNTVFQQYALFPHMTVHENIAFGLEMRKTPRSEVVKRVGEALEMTRLSGYDHRRTSQLSGGEQQRVALARALVNRPAILLLDEPLAALDLKLRKEMQSELKDLQREVGITFLFVTHDQGEAMALSNTIAVMRKGKIQQVGSAEEIYEHPKNRFVADFIGMSNFLEGTVIRREGSYAQLAIGDEGVTVWGFDGSHTASGGSVAAVLRPERVTLVADNSDDGTRNAVPGTVSDATYLGNGIQYRIRISGGRTLVCLQSNRDGNPRFAVGTDVLAAWSADDLRVLEPEG